MPVIQALLASCASLAIAATPPAPGPNVLFIVVDDLRPELGCYGATHIASPNVDRLAGEGLLFERAYCQQAVCNPSRASVLSGCRPDTTGVMANNKFLRPMMPGVLTLPQLFKENGWHAASVGKVFHHSEREPGDDPESWSEPSWYHGEPFRHWFSEASDQMMQRLKGMPPEQRPRLIRGPPFEAAEQPDRVYPDGQTADRAIETMRRLKGGPFFLAVGFVKPHLPFTCPQKYWDLYPAAAVRLPANYHPPDGAPEAALHDWYELRTYGGVPASGGIPDAMALNLIRGYRACVSFMDAQLGRVLDELARLGLREKTVIIFWGDHGYHLGENGIFTKMTNFELGTRSPLIISVPGQKTAGRRTRALVELVDIYPTLADICGLAAPGHLEGLSFKPLIDDPGLRWKKCAFSQYLRRGKEGIMGRSLRTERWRYTEWTGARGQRFGIELYDHQNDTGEDRNIASETANRAIIDELGKLLRGGWRGAPQGPRVE